MTNEHWNQAYTTKAADERSWTQPLPTDSLTLIRDTHVAPDGPIIDIGGGASLLVDELIHNGYSDVTLLDVASAALTETEARLGDKATYICADITQWTPERTYEVWHDRAVFHFLTTPEQHDAYLNAFLTGTDSSSHLIIATFAPTGPESCSGLPVQRWSQHDLARFFKPHCEVISTFETTHTTPWGTLQPFTWLHARRK